MEFLLPIIGISLMLIAGVGPACLVLPRNRPVSLVEFASLTILFGAGLTSLAWFVIGLIVPASALQAGATAIVVGLALVGILSVRRNPIKVAAVPRLTPWAAVALCAVAIELVLVSLLTWHDWLGFDGLLMWETKAHLACTNGGIIPLEYFSDPSRIYSHQDYPLFVPLAENWIYAWSGQCGQDLAKLLFPFFFVASVGLLASSVSRLTGSAVNGLVAAILPLFVPALIYGSGSATSGYADYALATVYLACGCYFLEYNRERNRQVLPVLFVLLSILPWIKQEGAILFVCVGGLLLALALATRRDRRTVLVGLVAAVVPLLVWRAFVARAGASSGQDFLPVTLSNFLENYGRTAEAGRWTAGELLNLRTWSFLWPVFALCLLIPRPAYGWRDRLAAGLLVALPLTLYIHLYVFSNYGGVTLHVASSMPRLLTQLALVAILGIALCAPRIGLIRRTAQNAVSVRVDSRWLTELKAGQTSSVGEVLHLVGADAHGENAASSEMDNWRDERIKTVVVVGTSGPARCAVCVLLDSTRLDLNGAVRRQLGEGRAALASSMDIAALTGSDAAHFSLLDMPSTVPIWIDRRVMHCERVMLSDGSGSQQFLISPKLLCELPHAQVVDGLAREAEVAVRV
jgi:prolyl-tRNA editing enzyme YbaK/EbsC (Cys-tRNA(Pro) deacylase)